MRDHRLWRPGGGGVERKRERKGKREERERKEEYVDQLVVVRRERERYENM